MGYALGMVPVPVAAGNDDDDDDDENFGWDVEM
jgi:hypothetical protein